MFLSSVLYPHPLTLCLPVVAAATYWPRLAPLCSPVENKSQLVKSLVKMDVFGAGGKAICSDGSRALEPKHQHDSSLSVLISVKL